MISEKDLRVGSAYFTVGYCDVDLTVPFVEPHIYVGKNIEPDESRDGVDYWYFQDPQTFFREGPFTELPKVTKRHRVLQLSSDDLDDLLTLQGVVDALYGLMSRP